MTTETTRPPHPTLPGAVPRPAAGAPSTGEPSDATAEALDPVDRSRLAAALDAVTHPVAISPPLVIAGASAWVALALVCALVPDSPLLPPRDQGYIDAANPFTIVAASTVAAGWLLLWGLSTGRGARAAALRIRIAHASAWVVGSAVYGLIWVLSTAKTALLAPPYLVAPQEILDRLWDGRVLLAQSLGNSLLLLGIGFVIGLLAGLITGVTIGWFQTANYWVHPVIVFIGPVPSLAWVPIVFVLFPSAYSGAVFMIALAVWFPVTVLTRAGILSVPRSYVDVAQTLGASTWFLVWRVSLPAALPNIFTGVFMALGSSFVALTVAENFGVNSGLGWFLNWKKSWGDFPGLYAGILVLVAVCGLALILLFRIRNHVLRWEKELTRW